MEGNRDRHATTDEIIDLDARCRELEAALGKSLIRQSLTRGWSRKAFLYTIFGRRLTLNLGQLIIAMREKKAPILGREMAQTLDAALRKLIGYKRWLVLFGSLAALPGLISLILLWQQNAVVATEVENVAADTQNGERGTLLTVIYSSTDRSEFGALTTPIYSTTNRARAVLRLIERDRAELLSTEERDLMGLNHFVDISQAPLGGVDFSPAFGDEPTEFYEVSFMSSNLLEASFDNCKLERVWFSSSFLWNTTFQGAVCKRVDFADTSIKGVDFRTTELIDCSFAGATFDADTEWPEGFDPIAAGATPFEPNPGGAQ